MTKCHYCNKRKATAWLFKKEVCFTCYFILKPGKCPSDRSSRMLTLINQPLDSIPYLTKLRSIRLQIGRMGRNKALTVQEKVKLKEMLLKDG